MRLKRDAVQRVQYVLPLIVVCGARLPDGSACGHVNGLSDAQLAAVQRALAGVALA